MIKFLKEFVGKFRTIKPYVEVSTSQENELKLSDYLKVDSTSKTGLRWIKDRGTKVKAGDEAFTSIRSTGRYGGRFDYNHFDAHQVVMFLTYGEWSSIDKHIDHIDGNPLNNSITNLRFVTPTGNQRNANRKLDSRNTTGIVGLTIQDNRFRARYVGQTLYWGKSREIAIARLEEAKANDPQFLK